MKGAAVSLLVAIQPEVADAGNLNSGRVRPVDQERGKACSNRDAAHEADRRGAQQLAAFLSGDLGGRPWRKNRPWNRE